MAVIRLSELKEMSTDAMKAKLAELEAEIGREKGSVKATGKPVNSGKYREMRKVVARIKTLLGQRGIRA